MVASSDDILQSIRSAVSQTLEMAEADSKLSDENKSLLSQLILTRRGDGEIVLDVAALQRLKSAENQWSTKERNEQDRFINPTRLPQVMPGLKGLQPGQYLSFVQRPLEKNGDNGPFLEAAAIRIYDQYNDKALAAERNRLFGAQQRYVAKLLVDALITKTQGITDQAEIDKLRTEMPAKKQFELAAQELGVPISEVMNLLFKLGVALTLIERIKAKAVKIKKSQTNFEGVLRHLAHTDSGPAAKTRIKELFLGFKKDLDLMGKEFVNIPKVLEPVLEKMNKANFDETFATLHRSAARLDAISTRWMIIINEANNKDKARSDVNRIKGMHKVYTD